MKFLGVLLLAIALAGCATKSSTATPPPVPLSITSPLDLPEAVPGQPYAFTLTATGGVPPYSWSLISSEIPGTVVSPGGVLTVTPRQQYVNPPAYIMVKVTDSAGMQSTQFKSN